MHQNSVISVIIGTFLSRNFSYEPSLCNICDNLKQKTKKFNDFAIAPVKERDYGINFWWISKDYAITIMNNSDLSEKSGVL